MGIGDWFKKKKSEPELDAPPAPPPELKADGQDDFNMGASGQPSMSSLDGLPGQGTGNMSQAVPGNHGPDIQVPQMPELPQFSDGGSSLDLGDLPTFPQMQDGQDSLSSGVTQNGSSDLQEPPSMGSSAADDSLSSMQGMGMEEPPSMGMSDDSAGLQDSMQMPLEPPESLDDDIPAPDDLGMPGSTDEDFPAPGTPQRNDVSEYTRRSAGSAPRVPVRDLPAVDDAPHTVHEATRVHEGSVYVNVDRYKVVLHHVHYMADDTKECETYYEQLQHLREGMDDAYASLHTALTTMQKKLMSIDSILFER